MGDTVTRRLAAIMTALAVTVPLVILSATPAGACSCALVEVQDLVPDAHIVLSGWEVGRDDHAREQFPTAAVTFAVDTIYKGEAGAEVTVFTGMGGGDCGVPSLADQGLVGIIVWTGPDGLNINSCGSVADPAALAAILGPGVRPAHPDSPASSGELSPLLVVGGPALLAAAGITVWSITRRRRRTVWVDGWSADGES